MIKSISRNKIAFLVFVAIFFIGLACQKVITAPSVPGPAAITIVNAVPNSSYVIPVINTSSSIMWFENAIAIGYGGLYEYSPPGGDDTVYVVQYNSDTLDIASKGSNLLFNGILNLKTGGIYSLFLCGADTSSPDYLFINDTLPFHKQTDSTVGIRFVNLSTGSQPISINLEGSPMGSEISNLPYKASTTFKNYFSNTEVGTYLFVIRDAATGDSLTQFSLSGNGYGLTDQNGNLLTFTNVTIAIYGSELPASNFPLSTMLIE